MFQCVWALTILKIGNHIARYQNLIIRRVLQLQGLFRLPKCVRIFSKDDQEIPDADIKVCAGLLVWCFLLSALVIAGTLLGKRPWSAMTVRLILVLAAVNGPFCILLWIILAVSGRRRADYRRRRTGPVARSCHQMKEDEEMVKPAEGGTIMALAATASRLATEQESLHWDPEDLF